MRRVNVVLRSATEAKLVRGIPVKIGVIEDLFAATPYWGFGGVIIKDRFNITHIPSGLCFISYSSSPEAAVKAFEERIKKAGKRKYQSSVRKAMRWLRHNKPLLMDTGTSAAKRKAKSTSWCLDTGTASRSATKE